MNDAKFKLSLSSKLEFRLEYCWLLVPGWLENFTGLLICIICYNLSNNGPFTLATLPFCNLTTILKRTAIYIFEFQRMDREMNSKGKANHACLRPCQIMQIDTPVKFSRQPGTRSEQ